MSRARPKPSAAETPGDDFRFRALVEHAPVCIHEIDLEGRLVSMNPAGLALMGAANASEVEGLRYLDAVCSADRDRVAGLLERARAGETSHFEFSPELPGSPRVFQSSFIPIRDEQSRVHRLMGITEDITLRRDTDARLRRLIEKTVDLVAVIDPSGRILYQSEASRDALGLEPDEIIGRKVSDFVHPDDLVHTMNELKRPLREPGGTARAEYRFRDRKGGWRNLESVVWNLSDDPFIRGLLVTSRDVTDQRRAEAQLRQAQKMEAVGKLTGGVAHDFNNLLAIALGNLERARAASRSPEVDESIDAAIGAIERGATLTQQLLAFSRKQTLRPRPLDLNHHVVRLIGLLSLGEGISIETRLAEDLWSTRVDPTQLESALLNLSLNARDAMSGGGRLEIETANVVGAKIEGVSVDCVRITIRDDGEGMESSVQDQAFEPFFTTKPEGRGSGLGLSMVYGFANQSGGACTIRSERGRGTEVSLFLPRSVEHAQSAAALGDHETWNAQGRRALLVEDEPGVRRVVQAQLERLGFEVSCAADAKDAHRAFERLAKIDVLISDVGLPGGVGGPELAARLRREQPGVPVLLITGYAADGIGPANELAGVDVLRKPFRYADLAGRLRHLLGSDLEAS